jgi:aryl-alcohol dehydrogenase-like predicted oxidoreductase
VLLEIAEGHDVSPARVALAWLLARPGITTVIVGARTDEQLADNLAAAASSTEPPGRRKESPPEPGVRRGVEHP